MTFELKSRDSHSKMVFNNVYDKNSLHSITIILIIRAVGEVGYCSTFLFMTKVRQMKNLPMSGCVFNEWKIQLLFRCMYIVI